MTTSRAPRCANLISTILCATVALSASGSVCAQAVAKSDLSRRVHFNIPAQPLANALIQFSAQTGLDLSASTDLVEGKQAAELKGTYATGDALRALLHGTDLEFVSSDGGVVAIKSVRPVAGRDTSSGLQDTQRKTDEGSAPARARLAQVESERVSNGASLRAADASSGDRSAAIEEVIVTAQKREERLIDTPQSVSVLSGDTLATLGATQFRDFASTVPGLSFTTVGAGFTQISLRGVTAGIDISPTVGIYVDDVPYGSSSAFTGAGRLALDVGLFDIDRVEVLRGPQGTLYGASTMGGLIKYVTRLPDTGSVSGETRLGVSSTESGDVSYSAAAAVNAPLATDKAAVRLSGFESHDGGYADNLLLGDDDVNSSDIYGGRADLLLTPTDALTVRIAGFLQNISRDGQATADYSFAGAPQDDELDQRRGFAEPFDQHFRVVSGTVDYDFGPVTLTSVSSYQTGDTQFVTDSRQFIAILQTFFARTYSAVAVKSALSIDKFVQEVRLTSAGAQPLEWVLGGFYTRESSQTHEQFKLLNPAGQPALNDVYDFISPSSFKEYAAFGDLTWRLTEQFDISGGLRYAHNEQSFEQIATGFLILPAPERSADENVVTYLANTRYRLTEHRTAYLRYATGYRPGGPNYVANSPTTGLPLGPLTFDADRLKSYEAGFRAETQDRTYSADLSVYHIDWNNIQIASSAGGFTYRANAPGGATIDGAELSLIARPTDDFMVTGALGYQDARMSEADTILRAAKDERLPNVPDFTATASADYTLPLGDMRPTIGATVRHVSDRMASFNASVSNPQYRLPDYQAVDLRTAVTLGRFNVQLYVHNLLDERGQLSAQTNRGRAQVALLQPRTIGMSVSADF